MCAGHAIDADDDDIRVFLAVLVVVGAEQDWVCFFAERPAGASSFLGGRQRFIAAHRSRVLHSQPASQTAAACLLALLVVALCCCSRAAADTRSFQAILPHRTTHHSTSSDDISFLCPTTATPHYNYTSPSIHLRQQYSHTHRQ